VQETEGEPGTSLFAASAQAQSTISGSEDGTDTVVHVFLTISFKP